MAKSDIPPVKLVKRKRKIFPNKLTGQFFLEKFNILKETTIFVNVMWKRKIH